MALEFVNMEVNSHVGFKLLGDIQEVLGKKSDARRAYQRSVEIDPNQEDVLLKRKIVVLTLLCISTNITVRTVGDLLFEESCDVEDLKTLQKKAKKLGYEAVVVKYDKAIEALENQPGKNKLNNLLKKSNELNDSFARDNSGMCSFTNWIYV